MTHHNQTKELTTWFLRETGSEGGETGSRGGVAGVEATAAPILGIGVRWSWLLLSDPILRPRRSNLGFGSPRRQR
jgi:hypothetical protein